MRYVRVNLKTWVEAPVNIPDKQVIEKFQKQQVQRDKLSGFQRCTGLDHQKRKTGFK